MMTPERSEAAAAVTAPPSSGPDAAPRPGTEEPEARASLRWPFRSREQQDRARQRANEAQKSDSNAESSDAGEGDGKNSDEGWENDEEADSDSGASAQPSTSPAQARPPAGGDGVSDEPGAAISQDWVAQRAQRMFVVGATGPQASNEKDRVHVVTKRLVSLAWAHMNSLAKEQSPRCRRRSATSIEWSDSAGCWLTPWARR